MPEHGQTGTAIAAPYNEHEKLIGGVPVRDRSCLERMGNGLVRLAAIALMYR